jgi:hypothetical protein
MNFAAVRTSSLTSAAELIRRVKDAGRLRPDIVLDDLIIMIMANDGIRAITPSARSAASRRSADTRTACCKQQPTRRQDQRLAARGQNKTTKRANLHLRSASLHGEP